MMELPENGISKQSTRCCAFLALLLVLGVVVLYVYGSYCCEQRTAGTELVHVRVVLRETENWEEVKVYGPGRIVTLNRSESEDDVRRILDALGSVSVSRFPALQRHPGYHLFFFGPPGAGSTRRQGVELHGRYLRYDELDRTLRDILRRH